ncbi:MAG: hypothetical protein MI810_19370 [Flavobacteriales bacterium]|nr:hypothetical protein [Flavobacteriales bacterium]
MGRRIGTLGLVNYKDHPTDNRYKVFNFYSEAEADLFEKRLSEWNIWYEKDVSDLEKKGETVYLFAVPQKEFSRAQKANFEVSANYRKPLIPNKILRYSLVLFFFAILALGIIGYVKNS